MKNSPMVVLLPGPLQCYNRVDGGYTTFAGTTEHEETTTLCVESQKLLDSWGIDSVVIDQFLGTNKKSSGPQWMFPLFKDLGATHAVCVRFAKSNSVVAAGHDYRYWVDSPESMALARALADQHQQSFPNSSRCGDKGIRPARNVSSSEGLFLRDSPCPSVMCRPFFHTHPPEWLQFKAHLDEYAHVIALGILKNINHPAGEPELVS